LAGDGVDGVDSCALYPFMEPTPTSA